MPGGCGWFGSNGGGGGGGAALDFADLAAAMTIAGTDLLVINQGADNVKTEWQDLCDKFAFSAATELFKPWGATSSFPALKRNGTVVQFRTAADDGYADFWGGQSILFDGATAVVGLNRGLASVSCGLALASGRGIAVSSGASSESGFDVEQKRDSIGTWVDTDASTGIGKRLTGRPIEANTAGSGAPNVLVSTESRKLLTNEGVTAENYHTLPSAAAGQEFLFNAIDSDGIRVTAAAGDEIEVGGSVSAVAGFIRLAANAKAQLVALNATRWSVQSAVGTITVDV